MWRLADYQGQLIANLIVAGKHAPERARRVPRDAGRARGAGGRAAPTSPPTATAWR